MELRSKIENKRNRPNFINHWGIRVSLHRETSSIVLCWGLTSSDQFRELYSLQGDDLSYRSWQVNVLRWKDITSLSWWFRHRVPWTNLFSLLCCHNCFSVLFNYLLVSFRFFVSCRLVSFTFDWFGFVSFRTLNEPLHYILDYLN